MTPPASAGSFPSPPTTLANGGEPARNGTTFNTIDRMKGSSRIFPHLDDLVAAKPDVSIHAPIRKVLHDGEVHARQADTDLDFRRPDLALQEFIKAQIVAVDMIPRHKDYPMLQGDRGELHRQYLGLKKRINAQYEKFEAVKQLIKENNAKNEVKPTLQTVVASDISRDGVSEEMANGHTRSKSVQPPTNNGTPASVTNFGLSPEFINSTLQRPGSTNGLPTRAKPPVQPKPDALHGKAIHTSDELRSASPQEDLAARFARLRAPNSTPQVQDPRIKTRPIAVPPSTDSSSKPSVTTNNQTILKPLNGSRPAGPREMPSVPSTLLRRVDTEIPAMPRPPDAIYSPARNSDTAATLNMPSSAPRGSSHLNMVRHGSTSSTLSSYDRSDFSREDDMESNSTISLTDRSFSTRNSRSREQLALPNSAVMSAEDLMEYLGRGSQTLRILLVDIRSREQFDNGHIWSQSIICVEPISLRQGMSAEELGESIVLSPEDEQRVFEKRDEFDLIIYYDQSSSSDRTSNNNSSSLLDFSKAIYDYGYEKRSKKPPVLLQGGLDAWVDLMGLGSLQSSQVATAATKPPNGITMKPVRPLSRNTAVRDSRRLPIGYKQKYESRPLSKEEESKWDAVLRDDSSVETSVGLQQASDALYVRTTEDFFRRFPEPSAIKESMTSPARVTPVPSYHEELTNSIPKAPTRPAPALPRQSFTGVSDKTENGLHLVSSASSARSTQPQIETISSTAVIPGRTGLHNEGTTCYMNAAVQCLSATPDISTFLTRFQYPPPVRIPRKSHEKTEPPQLMIRNFGNLLRHLWSGHYNYVTPKTFANYVYLIDGQRPTRKDDRTEAFGGSKRQHDSAEFLEFLLEILHDELNIHRNFPPYNKSPKEKEFRDSQPIMNAAVAEWDSYLRSDDSLISEQIMGEYVVITRCSVCHRDSRYWQPFTTLQVPIYDGRRQTVIEAIQDQFSKPEKISAYRCDRCAMDTPAVQYRLFSRLPNYLILQLMRFHDPERKITTLITFPPRNLDMEPMFVPHSDYQDLQSFKYDCYGVIQHIGQNIGSGHYVATINHFQNGQPSPDWWRYNDRTVIKSSWQTTQTKEASVLFYKRQSTP